MSQIQSPLGYVFQAIMSHVGYGGDSIRCEKKCCRTFQHNVKVRNDKFKIAVPDLPTSNQGMGRRRKRTGIKVSGDVMSIIDKYTPEEWAEVCFGTNPVPIRLSKESTDASRRGLIESESGPEQVGE